MLYHVLNYPAIGVAWGLTVALFTAAEYGHLGWALGVTGVLLAGSAAWQALVEGGADLALTSRGIQELSVMVGASLLGEAVRSRRALAAETRERLRLVEQQREQEAERRVTEERVRIARELHDVIAHTVAVIGVQAGVAADSIDDHPDQARAALDTIRATTREAMGELRATVGLLHAGGDVPLLPAPGLGQLASLIEAAETSGLAVRLTVEGEPRPLPGAVELTAYRVVQESLTNVVRHAGATTAVVAVRYQAGGSRRRDRRRRCPGATRRHRQRRWARPARDERSVVPRWAAGSTPGRARRRLPGRAAWLPRRVISVLLVDDQALVRAGFRALLEHSDDIEVRRRGCRRGRGPALARSSPRRGADGHPDAGDGRARGHPADRCRRRLGGVKVLVLTTFELDEYVFEALRAGASGFLLKDIDPTDLPGRCGSWRRRRAALAHR